VFGIDRVTFWASPIVVEVKPVADLKFSFGEAIAHKNHDTSRSDDNHRISE